MGFCKGFGFQGVPGFGIISQGQEFDIWALWICWVDAGAFTLAVYLCVKKIFLMLSSVFHIARTV